MERNGELDFWNLVNTLQKSGICSLYFGLGLLKVIQLTSTSTDPLVSKSVIFDLTKARITHHMGSRHLSTHRHHISTHYKPNKSVNPQPAMCSENTLVRILCSQL